MVHTEWTTAKNYYLFIIISNTYSKLKPTAGDVHRVNDRGDTGDGQWSSMFMKFYEFEWWFLTIHQLLGDGYPMTWSPDSGDVQSHDPTSSFVDGCRQILPAQHFHQQGVSTITKPNISSVGSTQMRIAKLGWKSGSDRLYTCKLVDISAAGSLR